MAGWRRVLKPPRMPVVGFGPLTAYDVYESAGRGRSQTARVPCVRNARLSYKSYTPVWAVDPPRSFVHVVHRQGRPGPTFAFCVTLCSRDAAGAARERRFAADTRSMC